MSTLKRLRRSIEAGKLIQKIEFTNGYEHVHKVDGKYEWVYANTERETFDTFEELYANVEADEEAFTQDELNTWQVAPKVSPEREAWGMSIIDAWKSGDDETLTAMIKDDLLKKLELSLFDGSIKNRRAKSAIVSWIARLRTPVTTKA